MSKSEQGWVSDEEIIKGWNEGKSLREIARGLITESAVSDRAIRKLHLSKRPQGRHRLLPETDPPRRTRGKRRV